MSKWTSEQLQAITSSGTNIIVSAGAGSGKTAVLTERVIDKLKNGIHINELLILTFTKAAASEMKDRIRNKISSFEEFKDEAKLLPSSYITTFDSYALSVVKKYHYLLNINKDISISDEAIVSIEHTKIIDEIFEELYESDDKAFEELIDKYSIKNDKAIREVISNVSRKIDGFINKEEFINYIYNDFFEEENINKIILEYYDLLREKIRSVEIEFENMKYYFDEKYMENIYSSISGLLSSDIDKVYLFKKIPLPNLPRNSEEEAKIAKTALKKSIDEVISFASFGEEEKLKENILSTKKDVFTILKIVEKYIIKMKEYKEKNNIYTFNDISNLAIKVVRDFKEAREEIKNGFKEIMIDEYQDTNDIQEIFVSFIENNNVYMVGDIKQSIYRFRGSNPDIFKKKYDLYSKGNGGIKIDLIKNFRSRNEVLNNINNIFELIMDYNIGGAEYKLSHEMVYGNTLYDTLKENEFNYDIDILEYENNTNDYSDIELEIFMIAKDIKNKIKSNMKVFDKSLNKLRTISYNDIVIICDRSKHYNLFKKIFEFQGIPLSILKDDNLNLSEDIVLIRNIIDFIIKINNNIFDEEFKYDLVSISRSFLYELSDSDIFDTLKSKKYKESTVYKSLSMITSIESKTSSMILEEILDNTDFYNKIYKIGGYEDINVRLKKIYEMSVSLSSLGYDIYMFKEYLDNIIESGIDIKYTAYAPSSECVKILTIHKSKGLEWPICYFADLDHKFNYKEIKDKVVVSSKYGLIVPDDIMKKNSVLKEVYKGDYVKEEISEKIRLFYVALTRAREKMIIVLPYKDTFKLEKNKNGVIDEIRRYKFNKLSDLIYGIKDYYPKFFKKVNISSLGITKDYLYNKSSSHKLDIQKDNLNVKEINILNEIYNEDHYSKESHNLIDNKSKKNMEFGTKIHEVFELIDFKNYDSSLIKNEFIRNKVDKFLKNDLLSNIKNANIYKEYEFIYTLDNKEYHGIIDLMLEYADRIDIIDYKLKNTKDEAYIRQLNGYKSYIESKSSKKVNLYLYSIIDEKINAI